MSTSCLKSCLRRVLKILICRNVLKLIFKGRSNTPFLIWMGECREEYWEWMIQSMKSYGLMFSSISYILIFFIFSRFWVNFCYFCSNFHDFVSIWANLTNYGQFVNLWSIGQMMVNLTNFRPIWKYSDILSQLDTFGVRLTHLNSN